MNVERINIVINTTAVDPISSSRVDHVTFCISARTSCKKFLTFWIMRPSNPSYIYRSFQERQESNLQLRFWRPLVYH